MAPRKMTFAEWIAASPELSDEEIDWLCQMMWGKRRHWETRGTDSHGRTWYRFNTPAKCMLRVEDRTRMRTFLSNLKAPPHG